MANGECKNAINKSQSNMASSPGYPNTTETQENNLKSMSVEMIMEETNIICKEIQEDAVKQIEAI